MAFCPLLKALEKLGRRLFPGNAKGVVCVDEAYAAGQFEEAARLLPTGVREAALSLTKDERAAAEEIRLRAGRRLTVLLPAGERELGYKIGPRELAALLDIVTRASAHSARERVRHGFITATGGHRVGLCGSAIYQGGEVTGFRSISSANIRIAREVKGAGVRIYESLYRRGFPPTLVISPPGGGKTTLLRDLIRLIAGGEGCLGPMRVSLADERGEVAALLGGVPQMDVGPFTDVMDSCPKAEAVMMLLRSMNPELTALDEITAPEDVKALELAANCGVSLLATAHADGIDDLMQRPLYRPLIEAKAFRKAVVIERTASGRYYRIENL